MPYRFICSSFRFVVRKKKEKSPFFGERKKWKPQNKRKKNKRNEKHRKPLFLSLSFISPLSPSRLSNSSWTLVDRMSSRAPELWNDAVCSTKKNVSEAWAAAQGVGIQAREPSFHQRRSRQGPKGSPFLNFSASLSSSRCFGIKFPQFVPFFWPRIHALVRFG